MGEKLFVRVLNILGKMHPLIWVPLLRVIIFRISFIFGSVSNLWCCPHYAGRLFWGGIHHIIYLGHKWWAFLQIMSSLA